MLELRCIQGRWPPRNAEEPLVVTQRDVDVLFGAVRIHISFWTPIADFDREWHTFVICGMFAV